MAIAVTCPECGAKYNLADHLAGKNVRCKSCSNTIPVPRAEADESDDDAVQVCSGAPREKPSRATPPAVPGSLPPRGRRSLNDDDDDEPGPRRRRPGNDDDDDDDEEYRRRRRRRAQTSGSNTGMIVGLVLAGVVLVVLIGVAVYMFVLRKPGQEAQPAVVAQVPNQPPPAPQFGQAPQVGQALNPQAFVPVAKLPDPARTAAWEVQPDPRPPVKPVAVASFPLKAKAREIHGIFYTPDGSKVVVVHAEEIKGKPKRQLKIDLHDNKGTFIKTHELYQTLVHGPNTEQLAAVTADSAKLILRNPESRNKLEVWDLTDGKKAGEWTPHGGGEISDLFVLGAGQVLSNARGQVALWGPGDNKMIYSVAGYRGALQLSPGMKYFVVCNGTTVDLMDAGTGKRKGQLIVPGQGSLQQLVAAAFSHDGKELAAVVDTAQGKRLARWNLATGDSVDHFPAATDQRPLRWLDQRFLVQDHPLFKHAYLVDCRLKGALMTYIIPGGQALTDPPDDRFWYFHEAKGQTFVAAVNLPDGQAQALADQVAVGQVQPAIPPGSAVTVEIDSNNEVFRADVNKAVQDTAASRGFRIGPGGFTIKLRAQGRQTGKTINLRINSFGFGAPPFRNITIQDYRIESDLQIFDPQGAQIHTQKHASTIPFFINFKTEEFQKEVEDSTWNGAKGWARSAVLPNTLFRVGGQIQTLPRMVTLQSEF